MSKELIDSPCAVCGKYSIDCNCGLFGSKDNESKEDHENRQLLYELTGIRDESLHVQPYADMIDKLTQVQKADFAKRALELERDCVTYKKMFEEVSRERNAWISEYRAARVEVEKLKQERKQIIEQNASQSLQLALIEQSLGRANATTQRLENDLSEAVEIMGAIYDNVDKYHLDFAFSGGECYDRLKDYLGV